MARKKKKERWNDPRDEMSNMDMDETSSMSSQFTEWADALLKCVDTMESSLKLMVDSNNMMKQTLAIMEEQLNSMVPSRGTAAPQLVVMHQTSTSQTGKPMEEGQVVHLNIERNRVNSQDSTIPVSRENLSPILSTNMVPLIIEIIPQFDGNKEDYGKFMTMFNHLVHENPEIPTTLKHALLLRLLTGEARAMFLSVSISKEEYERLRWNLERQYNRKKFSFSEYN
ncbi:hypothetical protein CRE_12241 [Caenorhabditis remanei]|uniref:Uncharacterized protein n=1 Tax=Caenorhabditis remanei TaxID=31234 RepID=E3N717_CAERE|nr:hypothetical protein CRE_12241 [Caenorhabditis remanei]